MKFNTYKKLNTAENHNEMPIAIGKLDDSSVGWRWEILGLVLAVLVILWLFPGGADWGGVVRGNVWGAHDLHVVSLEIKIEPLFRGMIEYKKIFNLEHILELILGEKVETKTVMSWKRNP